MTYILSPGDINKHIEKFYDNSTIYVPNKYSVILYGPAVIEAISTLRKSTFETNALGVKNSQISFVDRDTFTRWEGSHFEKMISLPHSGMPTSVDSKNLLSDGAVCLKWACDSVTIPTLDTQEAGPSSSREVVLDSYKNIKFYLVGDYDSNGTLSISVTEEKGMMWYQFFNALGNQFFNPDAMVPRDSLHRLSALVVPIITTEGVNGAQSIKYADSQHFEFNSMVYNGMGRSITFDSGATKPLTYTISFKCPNPFQESFKNTERGMENRFNDKNYFNKGSRSINRSYFEDNGK